MRENLTDAIEDYLKAIYALTSDGERASTNEIAGKMGVAPASVTGMVQKMAATEPPLVEYRKHHGVALTPAGRSAALETIRHHRLLETFLHDRLGYTWDEVHREADRLEHVISEDFEERIAQDLGDPLHDPHGEPIPTRDFQIPPYATRRLSELRPGQKAVIQRVENPSPDLLRYLSSIGLMPMAEVTILEYSPLDELLRIKVHGPSGQVTVGSRITRQIFVEVQEPAW